MTDVKNDGHGWTVSRPFAGLALIVLVLMLPVTFMISLIFWKKGLKVFWDVVCELPEMFRYAFLGHGEYFPMKSKAS